MLFAITYSDLSVTHQGELRGWFFANGLLYTALADVVLVDSVARTVTVNKFVPVPGQESLAFPEFVVDAQGEPVTVEEVIDLAVMPLTWMLTMRGAGHQPGSTPPRSLRRPAEDSGVRGSSVRRPGAAVRSADQASMVG